MFSGDLPERLGRSDASFAGTFIKTFQPILDGFYKNPPTLMHVGREMVLFRGEFRRATPWPPWTRGPRLEFDVCFAFTNTFVELRAAWDKSRLAKPRRFDDAKAVV